MRDRTIPCLADRRWLQLVLAMVMSIASSSPARADTAEAASDMWNMLMTHHIQRLMFEKTLQARSRQTRQAPSPKPLAATDFKPSPGHPTIDALLALVPDATRRNELSIAVAHVFGAVAQARANNVATAMAMAIGMAKTILDGDELPEEVIRQVCLTINDRLAVAPSYRKLKSAEKQAIHEYRVFSATVLAVVFEGAKTNPDAREAGIGFAKRFLDGIGWPTGD